VRVISAMRKSLAAVLAIAAVSISITAVIAAADPSASQASPYLISSFMGNIELRVSHSEAVDLGTYSYIPGTLFRPIPTPVNFAALKMDVSKVLSSKPDNPNIPPDTIGIGVWVRTPENMTARLVSQVGEAKFARQTFIYVDPYRNTPSYTCTTDRLWPLVNSSYGQLISVTFTAEDFESGLSCIKQSAGNLEVYGVYIYDNSHLYTEECTTASVRCTGLYGFAGMSIVSATLNGAECPVEGGTAKLSGPVSGTLTLNLEGRFFFIPYTKTVTFQL